MLPLRGIRVLDFTTLLPGPLATLMLAEAGADVIKVEPPGGEDLRHYPPFENGENPYFAVLNRGKRSFAANLREPGDKARILELATTCDVLVEQFRPGVMKRLGLDYPRLNAINPRIVYCSITGYGQQGARANLAGHDLNYTAVSGLLSLAADHAGRPVVPSAQVADIGGGTFPAIINILLALRKAEHEKSGAWLDISMADNTFCWQSWALSQGEASELWPRPGREILTGGSPRYNIYETSDGRYIAAAPLEDRFWTLFCETIGLDARWRDDRRDPEATAREVAAIIKARSSSDWQQTFADKDVCCSIVVSVEEARKDAGFAVRGLFERRVRLDGMTVTALPLPLVPQMRRSEREAPYPSRMHAIDSINAQTAWLDPERTDDHSPSGVPQDRHLSADAPHSDFTPGLGPRRFRSSG